MEQEAALPIAELVVLAARPRQHGPALLDVLPAATHPGALGSGKHVGPDVVLPNDALLGLDVAVVPDGCDRPCHVGTALLRIIDVAAVDAGEIGEEVEMVDVVIAAVDVGHAGDDLA